MNLGYVVFILCILAFQYATIGHKNLSGNSTIRSRGIIQEMPSSHSTRPKSDSTTHMSHSASQKTPPSQTERKVHPTRHPATVSPSSRQKTSRTALKSSPTTHRSHSTSQKTRVPTGHPTRHHATVSPTRRQKTSQTAQKSSPTTQKSSPTTHMSHSTSQKTRIPTGHPTRHPKTSDPIIGTIHKKTTSGGFRPTSSTATNSTTSPNAAGTLMPTKTLTVSNGQTASAQVDWIVVGFGIGGSISIGGEILPVAGGMEGIIEENSSGEYEVMTIDTATNPDTTTSTKSKSTSSSSPTPTPYNIYPRSGSTQSQQSALARQLNRIAQQGSVRSITGSRDRQLLWVASLTPEQAAELGRNPVVQGLNVDLPSRVSLERASGSGSRPSPICPPENCSHRKRDGDILMQANAHDDLKMFSQARGASLPQLPGYAYDSMGGDEITVYVVDTGVNADNAEFVNMDGTIRWLYLPGEPEIEGDDFGHGTCVTSKVVGPRFGVAKNVDIVVVKIYPIADTIVGSRFIAALGVAARDITSNNLQGKAVVSVAIGVDPHELSENDRLTYIGAVRDLIDLDVVLVAASGNRDDISPGLAVATYPALLINQFPIVVVGAVEPSGVYASYSQGMAAELTVSAAGRVSCASRYGTGEWQGTSFAAPAVAGLAAYLMSLDQYREQLLVPGSVARNVRDLIKSLAYARLPLQPAVVWNGIDSRQFHCPVRRDASGCPALNTTSPSVPLPHGTIPSRSTMNSESSSGAVSLTMPTSFPPSFPIVVSSSATTTSTSAGSSDLSSSSMATESNTTSDGTSMVTMVSGSTMVVPRALVGLTPATTQPTRV